MFAGAAVKRRGLTLRVADDLSSQYSPHSVVSGGLGRGVFINDWWRGGGVDALVLEVVWSVFIDDWWRGGGVDALVLEVVWRVASL